MLWRRRKTKGEKEDNILRRKLYFFVWDKRSGEGEGGNLEKEGKNS